jgi:hypothetical protein
MKEALLTSRSAGISDINDRASLNGTAISVGASASGHLPLEKKHERTVRDNEPF